MLFWGCLLACSFVSLCPTIQGFVCVDYPSRSVTIVSSSACLKSTQLAYFKDSWGYVGIMIGIC